MAQNKIQMTDKEFAKAIQLAREEAVREERERLGLIPPAGKLTGKTKLCKVYGRTLYQPENLVEHKRLSVLNLSDRLPDDRWLERKWWGKIDREIELTSEQASKKGFLFEGKHMTEKSMLERLAKNGVSRRGGLLHPWTFLEQLPHENWLEDDQGRKQGPSIQFDYHLFYPKDEFSKNEIVIRRPGMTPKRRIPIPPSMAGIPDLPEQKEVGPNIWQYVSRVQNYKDGKLNGITVYFNGNYEETGFEYYKDGKQHGLARHRTKDGKDWEYSYWENGKKIMDDTKTRAFLKARVEKLKMEKQADSSARSTTLRKVLKAGTKKQKLRILSKFHSQNVPVKRRVSQVLSEQFIKKPDRR